MKQRGNIIVFVLIGLVLFGVLLGSVWWLKDRFTGAPVATDTTQQTTETDTDIKQDQNPRDEAADSEDTAPATSDTSAPARDAATPQTPESQTPRTGPSEVAASGPLENTLLSSLALGTAVFLGTSFARSRR